MLVSLFELDTRRERKREAEGKMRTEEGGKDREEKVDKRTVYELTI